LGHAVRGSRFVLARFVLSPGRLAVGGLSPGRLATGGRGAYRPGAFVRLVEHGSVESRHAPRQHTAEQLSPGQPPAEQHATEPGDIAQPEQFVAGRHASADVVP